MTCYCEVPLSLRAEVSLAITKESTLHNDNKGRDSTVITLAEVSFASHPQLTSPEPSIHVVEHYQWTGISHSQLYPQMVHILKDVWNCHRIAVDATGIGQPVASFLRHELGNKVIPFTFTQNSKSELGFELLAGINSGRVKIYQRDGSSQYQELMFELEYARAQYRPNQTMNFYVEPSQGHDDFLMSLALLVKAARSFHPRQARGWLKSN